MDHSSSCDRISECDLSIGFYNLLNNATNLSTASTLAERDAFGATHLTTLQLDGATSGTLSLSVPAIVTTYTLLLPSTSGLSGQFLTTDGTGVSTWITLTISDIVN